jgi:type III restriction enzyme
MLIVDDDKKCDTNDMMKAKGLPVSKWKDHVKTSASVIDIIIFKMVITEGWDIPRACMLYQIRDSKSKQLDEQVIGRVRRNPKLLQFETLSQEAKDLISVAYVWGLEDKEHRIVQPVKVAGKTTENEIQKEMKIRTTRIKKDLEKKDFDLPAYLDLQKQPTVTESIFSLYKKYKASSNEVKTLSGEYVTNFGEWFKFMNNIDGVSQKSKEINCNYSDSMELVADENGIPVEVTLPLLSFYTDNEHYVRMNNWIWVRSDSEEKEFSFDSLAEKEWAKILIDLTDEDAPTGNGRIIKSVTIKEIVDNEEEIIKRYLFGKNFLSNSDVKFEYYLNGIHASYPDFIMKDYKDRIHLFETKSINQSSELYINKEEYEAKVDALKECYKQASILTGYYFYLPVQVGSDWQIFRYFNGEETKLSLREFKKSLKNS